MDVGCGSKPYRDLVNASRYVGLDYDSSLRRQEGFADVYYDGGAFPFTNEEFDGALCSQVLAHVFNPAEFLGEIARIWKPGGHLVLTVPFVWDEHEQPFDCARYSTFGLQAMLQRAGFETIEHRKTLPDIRVFFQLFNAYLFKVTLTSNQRVNQLMALVLMAPVNVGAVVVNWVTSRNPDLYLAHVVVALKLHQ